MAVGLTACSSGGGSPGNPPDGGPSNPDASAGGGSSGGKGSGGASSGGASSGGTQAGSGGSDTHRDGGGAGRDASSGGAESGGAGNGGAESGGSGNGGASDGGSGNGGAESGGSGNGGAESGGSGNGGAESGGASSGGTAGDSGTGGVPADASPCHACASGICLADGGCAECGKDADCHDPTPRCNAGTNTCVACIPGGTDNCANGQYCDSVSLTCKSGCKTSDDCGTGFCNALHVCLDCDPNGTDTCTDGKFCTVEGACIAGCKADGTGCASNVCDSAHECSSCVSDSECAPGHVCSSGTCLPNCGHDNDCPSSLTCCGDRCADLTRDHSACLACGTACAANQFCGTTGCQNGTIANVCGSVKATFLKDGLDVDDAEDDVLSANTGLTATCTNTTVTSTKQELSPTINPTTGQPVVGSGNLQVVVGGPFGQSLIRYLDAAAVTSIYSTYDNGNEQFRLRSGGTPPVDVAQSTSTDGHDFVLIETVVDPTTGTLMLAIDGFQQYGTTAGVWYFLNTMLPSLSTYTKSYYVYEWTDSDGDKAPSSGDAFSLVTSGP